MHIIRLRGPWERQVAGSASVTRGSVPDSEGSTADAQSILYLRRFNKPTGLEPQERVYLQVDHWQGERCWVELNGRSLASSSAPPLQVDITAQLSAHNLLSLRIDSGEGQPPSLVGEVNLAIEP